MLRVMTIFALLVSTSCEKESTKPPVTEAPDKETKPIPAEFPTPISLEEAQRHYSRYKPEVSELLAAGLLIHTPGADAMKTWEMLRAEYDGTGWWPLIVSKDLLESAVEVDPDAMRQEVAKLDAMQLLANEAKAPGPIKGEFPPEVPREPNPFVPAPAVRYELVDIKLETHIVDEVLIAIMPVKYPAEAVGLIGFGAYNANPTPEIHVAINHYWYSKYEAEPLAATDSTLELFVRRPPRDEASAMALAREVYSYCPDSVWQGAGSLEHLAADLRIRYWQLWWD